MRWALLTGLLVVWLSSLNSCKDFERPIDSKTKKLIDTIVAHRVDSMRPLLDSLCLLQYDTIYQLAFDSIMQIRLEQKRELMEYESK